MEHGKEEKDWIESNATSIVLVHSMKQNSNGNMFSY